MKKLYIILIFIIVEIVSISLLTFNSNSKKEQILNSANSLVKAQYDTVYHSFETLANTVFRGYINKQEVLELFEKRDREGLYNYLKDDYKYLSKIDFKQIHFHLPNNNSFLRMHKPKRFGDDLSDIRYSVAYVNREKKPIIGLEMGRVVPGFRYVYPLSNKKGEHLGSIETSFSVKSFINRLERVYDVHTHFLLDKRVFEKKIFDSYKNFYEVSLESDDYIFLKREVSYQKHKKDISKLLKKDLKEFIDNGIDSKKSFSFELKLHGKESEHIHKIVTFLVLQNIEKEDIGYFVVYQDSKKLLQLEKELYQSYIIFTIINILLFLYLYKVFMQREFLVQRVKEKTKVLREKTLELERLNSSLELRIEEEVKKSKEQEYQLYEIEKMAQMGEMIGNIAHQWRQPLNAISITASSTKLQEELELLNRDDIFKNMDMITKNTQFLSETIDTFREYISQEHNKVEVEISKVIDEVIRILSASLKNNQISLECARGNREEKILVSKELSQVMINIITNAKDVLKSRSIKKPWIKIEVKRTKEGSLITIEDNAGGIPEDILPKIFDPYFTTKHKGQGVGLGLNISYRLVLHSLKGKLYAKNSESGAKFFIELPSH